MSNEYLLTWKAERGYYKCDPEFRWLSDEECAWWENQKYDRRDYEYQFTSYFFGKLFPEALPSPIFADTRKDKEIVRAKLNMVDLYSFLFPEVQLPRITGRRYVQVCCALHGEKNASMSLDTVLKRYNCFSCGEKGDIFNLWMKVHNCTFPEAVDALDRMC